jgi:3-hydroxybutyryl-CoA dehydrogenase
MRSTCISILGGGLMGQGIAVVFLSAGNDVVVFDTADRLTRTESEICRRLREWQMAGDGTMSIGRLNVTASLPDAVAGADYVVECLPELEELKVANLAVCDALAPPEAIFLSNTSSLPLSALRIGLNKTRDLLATHFFNPAEIVPGVEIAGDESLDADVLASVERLLRDAGKVPIHVASAPAYIGNRLQLALFREALLCVDEGLASPAEIDTVVKSTFGFRLPAFGPFEIADMAGLDVFAAVLDNLRNAYGDRFSTPSSLLKLVEEGATGVAAGKGFYSYAPAEREAFVHNRDAAYRAVLAAVAR